MANADFTVIADLDSSMLRSSIEKVVSRPYTLNLKANDQFSGALGQIRGQLGMFDKSLSASTARVLAFSASAGAMFTVIRAIKELVTSTIEVEKRFTSINSILGASKSEFAKFGSSLFGIARDTSSSFGEVADAAEELARQGLGVTETLKRTASAMQLVRISGIGAVSAVEAITAALNSSHDALLTSESLLDKLVSVDAKFAVSASGLAEAIKRVGSVASDAGLGIDELIAAITSAQQTTARGEAVIGNALKTIFTRTQRPKVLEDFEALGIATKDAEGKLKPLADILVQVAKQYDTLSSAQQSNLSEIVGGIYQINILKALFRDLNKETSFYGDALETAQNASGNATKRMAELNQTLGALFERFKTNITQVGSGVGENVFSPLGKSLLKGMNATLEGVANNIDEKGKTGLGKALEIMFQGAANALSGPVLIGGLIVFIRLMRQLKDQGGDALKTLSGLASAFHNLSTVEGQAAQWLKTHPEYLDRISAANKTAAGSTLVLAEATAAFTKDLMRLAQVEASMSNAGAVLASGATKAGIYSGAIKRGGPEVIRQRGASSVPNFSSLSESIYRESQSVNPSLIRVGSHSELRSPGNPNGLGVYNLRDEPLGLGQGVQRAKSMGLNPKTHGSSTIPNFIPKLDPKIVAAAMAAGPTAWQKFRESFIGNSNDPDHSAKYFGGAIATSFAAPAVSAAFGGQETRAGRAAEGIGEGVSTGLTAATFLRGPRGGPTAIAIGATIAFASILKQAKNSFNTLDAEAQVLKGKLQKAGDGLGVYSQTLEQLSNAYLDGKTSSENIIKLQNKLAETLADFPDDLKEKLMGATNLEQINDISRKYSKENSKILEDKELGSFLSKTFNDRNPARNLINDGSNLLEVSQFGTKFGEQKLNDFADTLLQLMGKEGLKNAGGAAGLGSDVFGALKKGGLSDALIEQIKRMVSDEFGLVKTRLVSQAGKKETDAAKFEAMTPKRQAIIEQTASIEKRLKSARDAVKQTFETIGNVANQRIRIAGRQGLMRATGVNEEIQGLGSLMGETSSPNQMAATNYRAQVSANQLKATGEVSEVFTGMRERIMGLFNKIDLSRVGDVPANLRKGQSDLLGVFGRETSIGGLGKGAMDVFKSLGKDENVAEIKKLMADSNEKLVDIQQTQKEGNKIAGIQRDIAIRRADFDRTLKAGGGLGSFMDRGEKFKQIGDIYGAQFGMQSGIFKGQGAIDLVKSYLGAGGKADDKGVSGLLGTATEERALDIIESQKDLNRAFKGSGLQLPVPNLAKAREIAGTQIAAELKTGDSAMEKQMNGLQNALQQAINESFGGQMSSAAQTFANVLAGNSTFVTLNATLAENTKILGSLDQTLKAIKGGVSTEAITTANTRAGGNIPIGVAGFEKSMAKAGGYNPGYIRRAGNLVYNSAESVNYLPGVREPVISPPPGSLAGFLHRQEMGKMEFGASGWTPEELQKLKQFGLGEKGLENQLTNEALKTREVILTKPAAIALAKKQGLQGIDTPEGFKLTGTSVKSIPKGFESGVGKPMDWKMSIRPQAQYPIGFGADEVSDNFENWKAKQLQLKAMARRRASLASRSSSGRFSSSPIRGSGPQFGKFPITGLPSQQGGIDPISRMQQVSGVGRPPLSVVEPGGLSAISESVRPVVPSGSPRVIGSANYGDFPTSAKSVTPLPLSAPRTPFGATLMPISPTVPLPVQIPGGGMVDMSRQAFPPTKAAAGPLSYPISMAGANRGLPLAQIPQQSSLLKNTTPQNIQLAENFRKANTFRGATQTGYALAKTRASKIGVGGALGVASGIYGAYELSKGMRGYGAGAKAGDVGQVASETVGQAFGGLALAGLVPGLTAAASATGVGAAVAGAAVSAGTAIYRGGQAIQAQGQEREAYKNAGLTPAKVRKMKEKGQLDWGIGGDPRNPYKGKPRNALGYGLDRVTFGETRRVIANIGRTAGTAMADSIYGADENEGAFERDISEYKLAKSKKWKQPSNNTAPLPPTGVDQGWLNPEARTYTPEEISKENEFQANWGKMPAYDRVKAAKTNEHYARKNGDEEGADKFSDLKSRAINQYNTESIIKGYEQRGLKLSDAQKKGIALNVSNSANGASGTSAAQYGQILGGIKGGAAQNNGNNAPYSAKPEEKPAQTKSELNVNVTMGGNLGVKSANVEFSEEQQLVINDMISQVTKGIREEINAIVKNMPQQRADVANVRTPTVPG